MAVWGQEYVDLFLNVALPSQLSPANLPAIRHSSGLLYKIYTTKEDESRIREHPAFERLCRFVETRIIAVERIDPSWKFSPLMQFHNTAIQEADLDHAALIFLSPDFVLADGTFVSLLRAAEAGYRVVLVLTLRLVRETAMPDLLAHFCSPSEHRLTASPRELTQVAFRHLHPIERTYFWGPGFSSFPIHAYWPVEEEGIIARCFYLHPLFVNPRLRGMIPQITVDADYVDLVCPDPSEIHIVRDSDEIACFELSPQSAIDENAAKYTPACRTTPWSLSRWAVVHANPCYRSVLHHWYFQVPIRVHTGDLSPAWNKAERASARTARRLRWCSLLLRKHPHIRDVIGFYRATKMNISESRGYSDKGAKKRGRPFRDAWRRINLDLTEDFHGTGWGEVVSNDLGQRWRWMGSEGASSLYLALEGRQAYVLKTEIHTVLGGDIYDLRLEANGEPAREQQIIREGKTFYHWCVLPENAIGRQEGETEIVYRIGEGHETMRVGLVRVICERIKRR